MSAPKLPITVISESLDPEPAAWLARHAQVVWCAHEERETFFGALKAADALVVRTYTRVDEALLDAAPRLRVVGRGGVGLDNIDVAACRRRGVAVVYTPDANTQAVVEYVLGLILDALRPRHTLEGPVTAEHFHALRKHHVGVQLDQLTLGILGFGRIGRKLGRVASAIGMRVLANDLLPAEELRRLIDYPVEFVDKAVLYRDSDVLSLHVDHRPENRRMINQQVLSQLKPSCLLINAARGMLLDATALAEWAKLVAGRGGQAVLDVHDPEPPGADYPLYGLSNVRLLPHLAARTHTATVNMSWVVRDVVAVLQGRSPQHPAP